MEGRTTKERQVMEGFEGARKEGDMTRKRLSKSEDDKGSEERGRRGAKRAIIK